MRSTFEIDMEMEDLIDELDRISGKCVLQIGKGDRPSERRSLLADEERPILQRLEELFTEYFNVLTYELSGNLGINLPRYN